MPRRRWVLAIAGLLVLVVASADSVSRRVRAAWMLSALAGGQQADASEAPLVETDVVLPAEPTPVRARLYTRADRARSPGLVVAHGVHYRGIDERRLVPFARALARGGRAVLTPELSDLTDYRITAQGVDVIARSARWLSERTDVVSSPKVGVLGFSFAGGLALVAAERPELAGRLEFVSSVGGHHDLERVLGFLLSNRIETPSGPLTTSAHEYGLVVLLYQHVGRFVDDADREVMTDVLRFWLREDRPRAWARASQRTTASAERLFLLLASERLRELAPELEIAVAERAATLRALSPRGRLRGLGVPVYLLHGAGDSVIPPSETDWAARELEGRTHRALVTPLIEHVEVSHRASFYDELALVEFIAHVL